MSISENNFLVAFFRLRGRTTPTDAHRLQGDVLNEWVTVSLVGGVVPQSMRKRESLRLMPFFSSITARLNKSQLLKLLLFRLWRFHQQDTLVQKGRFWGLSWAAPHFYFPFLVENSEIVTLNTCINCHLVTATSNPTPATLLKKLVVFKH